MKFLNQRGYLSHNLRRATGGAGVGVGAGGSAAAGGFTGTRRVQGNTSGGFEGFRPSQTRIKLGSKSTQVALSSGNGARARW